MGKTKSYSYWEFASTSNVKSWFMVCLLWQKVKKIHQKKINYRSAHPFSPSMSTALENSPAAIYISLKKREEKK